MLVLAFSQWFLMKETQGWFAQVYDPISQKELYRPRMAEGEDRYFPVLRERCCRGCPRTQSEGFHPDRATGGHRHPDRHTPPRSSEDPLRRPANPINQQPEAA